MTVLLFLSSAGIMALCAATALRKRKYILPLLVLCLLAAPIAAGTGLVLCGHGASISWPGNPKAVVTDFFAHVRRGEYDQANALVWGRDCFPQEGLSEDTLRLLPVLAESSSLRLVGDPVRRGILAEQTLRITASEPSVLRRDMAERSHRVLSQHMICYEREELFTQEGEYLDGVRERAYTEALQACLAEPMPTCTREVTLHLLWTPFGWYLLTDPSPIAPLTGFDSVSALDASLTELRSSVQEAMPLLKKLHILDKTVTKGPLPDQDCFHTTTDPHEVAEAVAQAAELLEGQTLSWSPDIVTAPDTPIRYYIDSSILVIIWQEAKDNCLVTFTEIKLLDASQMFRTLCNDQYLTRYSSHLFQTPTTMATNANAVVAITGDFYRHRDEGTVVYQGEICRLDPGPLDMCFFDGEGNMIPMRSWTLGHRKLRSFIEDNDIRFSVSFGPILIQDGVKKHIRDYPVGENGDNYDRCAIGQLDDLHYLLLVATHTPEYPIAPILVQARNYLYEKGCVQGYTLDGGRTGTIVFNNQAVNLINYGGERKTTDMICFATAVDDGSYPYG